MNDRTIQPEARGVMLSAAFDSGQGPVRVDHAAPIPCAPAARSEETCKCRRLGDWKGSHHPLCDKAYEDVAATPPRIASRQGVEAPLETDALCACIPTPSRQRASRLLATIAAARFDLRKISSSNERTAVSTALDDAERLAREVIDNPVPDSVRAALERMCTPLDQSWLSGATAQADANCMKLIREYVLGGNAARG